MSTPGRRRSLRALARRVRTNKARVKAGKPAIIGGKKMAASTYKKRYGTPK
jgi:hypothetical protein